MKIRFLGAGQKDLHFLERIETECFPVFQQTSRQMLRIGIMSPFQSVLICTVNIKNKWRKAGSMILHIHKQTIRLYSIAVLPEFRGIQIGKQMLNYCREVAIYKGIETISLEVYAEDKPLLMWYEKHGYRVVGHLPDYYEPGKDAVQMAQQTDNAIKDPDFMDELHQRIIDSIYTRIEITKNRKSFLLSVRKRNTRKILLLKNEENCKYQKSKANNVI
jgi:ribosomal protein S18 acetylase RimI-like enzyme